ncbi:MAG: LysE family translocator [Pseudomonadota bacterium]
MTWADWLIFAAFWAVFVTTPGPNAVNCINNGMTLGFRKSLWGVAAILTQSILFQILSAAGVAALIVASPSALFWAKLVGAAVLIWIGVKGWMNAGRPAPEIARTGRSVYFGALVIATVNAKSVAGYLAAFTQFVRPDVPIWQQMWMIMPTALVITALSYSGYTAIGAALGRAALGTVFNTWFRRLMSAFFIGYGIALGGLAFPRRA